jgi:thymidylate synthase (FAD)
MGGDESVIAAARVSNGVEYSEASKGQEKDFKLISYLVKHKHGTPFEHTSFQFYVKVPLFVRSEWHRHRIGWSYNEISGRYVEYEPEFYIPDEIRIQGLTNKQGSTLPDEEFVRKWQVEWFLAAEDELKTIPNWNSYYRNWMKHSYDGAFVNYKQMLAGGVAKEIARMVLPVGLYTQFYATCNARSLMHFLNLRCAENAQWEIRQFALAMKEMFKEAMPLTYQAWKDNEFVSP